MTDTNSTIHILGFAGSLRKKSQNRSLLRAAHDLLPPNASLESYDLSPIPLYNGDVEATGFPEPVQQFRAKIATADAILIVTPEYNFSMPGVMKNAIDWASRPPQQPFFGKPLGIMGIGGRGGTTRAQYHLRQTAVFLNMFPINKPEVIVSFTPDKFDSDVNLIDEATRKSIAELLAALVAWTIRLKTTQP